MPHYQKIWWSGNKNRCIIQNLIKAYFIFLKHIFIESFLWVLFWKEDQKKVWSLLKPISNILMTNFFNRKNRRRLHFLVSKWR